MAQPGAEHSYRVNAWWTFGPSGIAKSESAPNVIHFSAPGSFGGLQTRWTPEEILLAAIAGCFTTTAQTIATEAKLDFADLEVESRATVIKVESGYQVSQIVIRPNVKIDSMEDRTRVFNLLKKAQQLCLVSRALSVSVKFEPQVEVAEVVTSVG